MMKHISECLHEIYHDEIKVITTNSLYGPNKLKDIKIKEGTEMVNSIEVKRFNYLRLHMYPIKYLSYLGRLLFDMRLPQKISGMSTGPLSPRMKEAILQSDADVICASTLHFLFADYPRWRLKSQNPKPFVLYGAPHIHSGVSIPDLYLDRIRMADQYIANTSFEKDYLTNKGIDPDKINVIGTATSILNNLPELPGEIQIRDSFGIQPAEKIILYVGRVEIFKGLPVLVKAFKSLQESDPNCRLIIAGASGSYLSELQEIAKKHRQILVLPDISEPEKLKLYRIADVVVLPSKEESFGVVFLEAWSFKKPVIGVNIGAIASVIENGVDGFLFEPDDEMDLLRVLKILVSDKTMSTAMGETGFQKVQRFYTWDKVASGFRAVYEKALLSFHRNDKIKIRPD